MSFYAHIRDLKTGKIITKTPVKADEAKDLTDSTKRFCCPGEVEGILCGADFENHICAKESPYKIEPYFRLMKGSLHKKNCLYDKANKKIDWKAESTKKTARFSFKEIIDFLQKKITSKDKKSNKALETQKETKPIPIEEIMAQIPSEYWDKDTQKCKENYNFRVFKEENGTIVDAIVRDANTGEEKWSYSKDFKEDNKKPIKRTRKKYGIIEKKAMQLYHVAANADEETKSKSGENILDISVNSLSFMQFRKGERMLNGPGIFVARRYNPADSIRNPIMEMTKEKSIDFYKCLIFYDAFMPDGTNHFNKRTEDFPIIALVECDTKVTRELVLSLITSTNKIDRKGKTKHGPYFVIACYWESVDIPIDEITRRVVIGKIFNKDQIVQIPDNENEEEKERLTSKGNISWPED